MGRAVRVELVTVAEAATADDGSLWLPLRRLDRDLGSLVLAPGPRASPLAVAQALQPVTDTLAALLMRESDQPRPGAGDSAYGLAGSATQLLRAALSGAGTFVWEWHVPSNQLGDIDEGFLQLGYDQVPERRSQEEVQKFTDRFIADVDKLVVSKEQDIMAV